MNSDADDGVSTFADDSVSVVSRNRKRRSKKRRNMYDQYLADSGSDESLAYSDTEGETALEREEFVVGMDINILIHQTVQNVVQSVCLEDEEGLSGFGDHELVCFAAAVKNNSSIVSLQIRHLDVSDVSLVPLCRALEKHPSLRALDISGIRGGGATSKAIKNLVCSNASIIFARVDDSVVIPRDEDIIQEAVRHNALVCADPSNNPFHLGLLRKISSMEEKEQSYLKGLQTRAWLVNTGEGLAIREPEVATTRNEGKKGKRVAFQVNESTKFGGEVCAQFVQGRCSYGSRCKYVHPERTSALKNSAALLQQDFGDSVSTGFSAATSSVSSRVRLQSRLRPSQFTLRTRDVKAPAPVEIVPEAPAPIEKINLPLIVSLWSLSMTIMGCSLAVAILS